MSSNILDIQRYLGIFFSCSEGILVCHPINWIFRDIWVFSPDIRYMESSRCSNPGRSNIYCLHLGIRHGISVILYYTIVMSERTKYWHFPIYVKAIGTAGTMEG